jgi:hypothetical protein
MDGFGSHMSPWVLDVLGGNNINAFVFPDHTTSLFQLLDFALFSCLKVTRCTIDGDFDHQSPDDRVMKLAHADEKTATSINIGRPFREAELSPSTGKYDPQEVQIAPHASATAVKFTKAEACLNRKNLGEDKSIQLTFRR